MLASHLFTPAPEAVLAGVLENSRAGINSSSRRRLERRAYTARILAPGSVDLSLGATRVYASVYASIQKPSIDRPNQGKLTFQVDYSGIADLGFQSENFPQNSAQNSNEAFARDSLILQNRLRKLIRDGCVVDEESLLISAGESCYNLHILVRAINNDGNLSDCGITAALLALLTFRKETNPKKIEDMEVNQDEDVQMTENSENESEEQIKNTTIGGFTFDNVNEGSTMGDSIPLSLHHLPVPTTFGFIRGIGNSRTIASLGKAKREEGSIITSSNLKNVILDPTRAEERLIEGTLIICMNEHKEVKFSEGVGISIDCEEDLFDTYLPLAEEGSKRTIEFIQTVGKIFESDRQLWRSKRSKKNEFVYKEIEMV